MNIVYSFRKAKSVFVIFLMFVNLSVYAQKFHFDVDYYRYFGLRERVMGLSFDRDEYKMDGWALQLVPRWDISSSLSAGVGVGLACYKNPDHGSLPLFATLRYKALKKIPDLYTFTDLGYSPRLGVAGFTGSIGVGYTHMYAKHFGLNFQLAYNLKRIENMKLYEYIFNEEDDSYNTEYVGEKTATRHSLSLGVGVTF